MVANPDKAHQQTLISRNGIDERLFTVAIGFAYLPLHTVAIHGMLEALLWHADEHLHGNIGLSARHHTENSS